MLCRGRERVDFHMKVTGVTIMLFYPFTPDSAKSKIDKFSKITNKGKLKSKVKYRSLAF